MVRHLPSSGLIEQGGWPCFLEVGIAVAFTTIVGISSELMACCQRRIRLKM
jgi:hypothetical protein